jgi:hypothetical protein
MKTRSMGAAGIAAAFAASLAASFVVPGAIAGGEASGGGRADQLPERLRPAYESIRPMDPYEYCREIASPRYEGRLTGHEGYTKAARWAAGVFETWNLEPIDRKQGYLQAYPSPHTIVDEAELALLLGEPGAGGRERALALGSEFLPLLHTASGDHTAPIVFVGWGISAPELGYDDYAGVDARGKFVLCFRGTPDRENKAFTEHDHHRRRMETAHGKGAVGVIYIYPEVNAHPNGDWIDGFVGAMISDAVADTMLAGAGPTVAALRGSLAGEKRPRSFDLPARARYRVASRHVPEADGYNVVGWIEGSDPKLRRECVVVGGHFDHCGRHAGLLFPGANDNASGSAVVMEIAEAFSHLADRPKRSVVFVLFGGEEQGLIGSTWFAEHLPPQFARVDAMFNFDMNGEGDGTNYGCTVEPPEFLETIRDADRHVGTLRRQWPIREVGVRSSDYAPFFQKGAACAAFFSNGPHLHYHETGDTIYRINPDMLADVARIGFLSAHAWADR